MNAPRRNMMLADALAQVGAVGLFLFSILAAVPKSLRHYRETVRQVWFVGAMSLVIIMTCGLFVGMVLSLQLYYVLTNFGGTAALGTVVALSMFRELGPVVTALLFAGRAGTSMTAEIGLMRATDQACIIHERRRKTLETFGMTTHPTTLPFQQSVHMRFPAGTALAGLLPQSLRCLSPQWNHHCGSARLALGAKSSAIIRARS
jgi:hypothetical protein